MSNDNIQRSKPFMDNYLPEEDTPAANLHHDYRDEIIEDEYDIMEDDGQPSEYDEGQDYMGGDDWDHGQYDHAEYEWDCDLYNEFWNKCAIAR